MKKQIVLCAILLGVSYSHAFVSVQQIQSEVNKSLQKKAQAKANQPSLKGQECAQFKGSWKGTCEGDDESRQETMTIEQNGCNDIAIIFKEGNRETYDLVGVGLNTKSSSGVFMTFGLQMAGRWSDDKKVVQIEGAAIVNSPLLSAPDTAKISAQAMLEGQDLVVYSKTTGTGTQGSGESVCRYKKVN